MFVKIIKKLLYFFILSINLYSQNIESGIKLIKYEKYDAAKKFFTSLMTPELKSQSYFYLGQIYFMNGNIDSAKISYLDGIKSNPEYALNYAGLVKVNVLRNETTEIQKNVEQAIEHGDKNNQLLWVILAEAFSSPKIKEYDKALEYLNEAVKSKVKSIEAYLKMGEVLLAKGNGTEAVRNFEEALNIDPKNAEALTLKAKVYILIDKSNESIELLNKAVLYDSAYAPAYRELAEVYAGLKDYLKAEELYRKYLSVTEVTLDKQKRYASILYVKKDYQNAVKILESIIPNDPNSVATLRILAYSYMRLGEEEKSKGYFERLFGLESAEFLSGDFENYADLLDKTGNDSLAIEYFRKVVDLDSTRKDILGKMSIIHFKNKDWGEVISILGKKNQLTAQEYFDLSKAFVFRGDGKITSLIQLLSNTLKLDDEQRAKIRQTLLHYFNENNFAVNSVSTSGSTTKVEKSVKEILSSHQISEWNISKNDWLSSISKGVTRDYIKADSLLNILAQKSPNLAVIYLWRARVNSNFDPESESGAAKPFYEKFIELAKSEPEKYKKDLIESYSYLGYYYYLQDDNQTSKNFWKEVELLDPNNRQAVEVLKLMK